MKSSSFAAIALTGFLTTVSASIQLAAPYNPVSGGRSTVTWTHEASAPAQFRIELQLASDSWAIGQIWEFVDTKADKLDVTWLNTSPYAISTKSIYRLLAVNQSFPDQVYTKSPTFRFLAPGSTVTTTTTTSTSSVTVPTSTTRSSTSTTRSESSAITKSSTFSSITSRASVPVVTVTATSSLIAATTTPPTTVETSRTAIPEPATTTTSTAPAQNTTTGDSGGVLGNNNNAAGPLSVSGGAVVVAALVLGLVSSFV